MVIVRFVKISMLAAIALFFTIVAYDNIFDFDTNWKLAQHVLLMDTTFRDPAIMSRAITSSTLQYSIYLSMIGWQILTAILCWVGCIILFYHIKKNNMQFNTSKKIAYLGLLCGFLLYSTPR